MEVKKYKIEKADTRKKLENQINDLIASGTSWLPVGGVTIQRIERDEGESAYGGFRTMYFQTMVQLYLI